MSSNDLRAAGRIGLTAIGSYFGGPIGGAVGAFAGNILLPNELPDQHIEGPRLADLKVTTSAYGQPLRIVYNNMRLAGNVIWSTDIQETAHTSTQNVGGKGGGGQDVSTTTYTHSVSFFVAFCEGPGTALSRIWANGKLIYDNRASSSVQSLLTSVSGVGRMTFYDGNASQKPDALMVAKNGDAPAYRGITGIFFQDMQLDGYGNRIPNIEAEIYAGGSVQYLETAIDNTAQIAGFAQQGTLCDDGLLMVVGDANSDGTFDGLYLLEPFTGSVLKKYITPTGFSVSCTQAPIRNSQGDISYFGTPGGAVYWPSNGTPLYVRDMLGLSAAGNESVGAWLDEFGNIYGIQLLSTPPDQYMIWKVDVVTRKAKIVSTITGDPLSAWYNYDGKITVTTSTFAGKRWLSEYSVDGGKLLRQVDLVSLPGTGGNLNARSICVAGDGSLFFADTSVNDAVTRVDPAWTTRTAITSRSSDGIVGTMCVTRDWSTGDVIFGEWTGAIRISAAGVILRAYTKSVSIAGQIPKTNPNWPKRIYIFTYRSVSSKPIFYLADAIVTSGSPTVASVIADICGRCGLSAGDIDVTALTSTNCDGFVVTAQMTARAALEQLMRAYFLDAVETAGKLKFIKRGGSSVATITEVDLIAEHSSSGDYERITRTAELELPNEVAVTFMDVNANYIQSSQMDRRLTRTSANKTSLQLPLALSANAAKQIASTLLYSTWVARTRHAFATSREYSHLEPGDVITLSINSVTTIVRITDVRDQGSLLAFQAVEEDSTIYTQSQSGGAVSTQPGTVAFSGPTNFLLLDISLLDANDDYGLYAAGGGYVTGWPGGKIFKSSDSGTTYADTGKAFTSACTIGTCTTTLAPYAGGNVFDESQSLTVVLSSGSLSSSTQTNVLSGTNIAIIGNEVIGFVNATLTAANTYVLTTLWRGLMGTSWATFSHRPSEQFVMLDVNTLRNLVMSSAEVSASRLFKAVTFGNDLSSTGPQGITFAANRLRPSPASQVGGGRNNSLDIILNWTRSVRGPSEWRDFLDLPLDEPVESYELDWYGGATTAMTSISQAANGLVTTGAAHGRAVGDKIFMTGIASMTNMNNRGCTILTVPTATTFTIDENTSGYSAGTGGVYRVRRAGGAVTSTTPTYTYTATQQTTDFGSVQSPAFYAVYQISSRVGRGYPAFGQI